MCAKWYVLRVQNGREEIIKEALEKRAKIAHMEDKLLRVLVPTETVTEIKGGKKKIRERTIYPGYIMVEMELDDESWYLVRETLGVGDFVGSEMKPIPMSETEVEKMLNEMERVKEEPKLKIDFQVGDNVKIKEGPFQNFDGVVDEVMASKGVVRVIVNIFGRATPVELEYWQVEPV